ncbi:MAG: hypothetical protein HQK53_17965, partial [Oligoflexia bacterium]|nr:hypothetical protein [Oligoflexia bacterium]
MKWETLEKSVHPHHFKALSATAIITTILALGLYIWDQHRPEPELVGTELLAGIDMDKIQKITIEKGKDITTILRSNDGFILEGRDFPLDLKKINELLLKLTGATITREFSTSSLGVKNGTNSANDPTNLKFKKDIKSVITLETNASNTTSNNASNGTSNRTSNSTSNNSINNAKTVIEIGDEGTEGTYVRLNNSNKILLSKEHFYISATADSYLDKTLWDID